MNEIASLESPSRFVQSSLRLIHRSQHRYAINMHDIMQSLATISVLLILVLYAMSIGDYYTVPDDVTSEDGDEEKMYDLFKIAEWRYKISASSPAELPKPVLSPVTVLTTSLAPVLVQNLEMINHGDENKSPLRQSVSGRSD